MTTEAATTPESGARPIGAGPQGSRSGRPDSGPMHASFNLGTVGGVRIGINWSWLVIFGLIAWSLADVVFPEENPGLSDSTYIAMAAIATFLFFASLLLHELGHAVVARREGMEIEGIVLWLFGGVAQFKGLFPSAKAELRIALAGPAVTVVIGTLAVTLGVLAELPDGVDGVVVWLGSINFLLLVFNMLPALPLDGGRVFRALLWQWTGDFTRATRIAGAIGKGFGQAMIFGGILLLFLVGALGGIWLAMIGWFLTVAADAESKFATISAALGSMRVSEAMARRPVTVAAGATLSEFVSDVFERNRYTAYPVLAGERVAGLVGFRDVAAVPRGQWGQTRVAEIARPADRVLVLGPDSNLGEAAIELLQSELQRGLVLADGRLGGLLSMTDVARLIALRRDAGR